MSRWVLLGAAGLAGVCWALTMPRPLDMDPIAWAGGGEGAPRVEPPPPLRPAPPPPSRNLFAYEDSGPRPLPPLPLAAPDAQRAPPSRQAGVRLVGLVWQRSNLKAALAIGDEVLVLGPGESGGGYRVEGVDADDGVRVLGPDGHVERLEAPSP